MTTTLDRIRTTPGTSDLSPDALAHAVWGITAEPGDSNTGALIAALGAHDALVLVLEDDSLAHGAIDVGTIRERIMPRSTEHSIESAFSQAARIGATLLTSEHPHWPAGFKDLGDHAPHALWVRGNTELLAQQPSTAVIGARAATGYGEHVTMELTAGLVERGHTIISGAAYGIDGMAHRAALASSGHTVAYLAGGVDRFYPSGHDALLTRITEQSAVASEISCGQAPTKWRFLHRKLQNP